MAPSQRASQTGLPSTGHALPAQLTVLEAIMRSDLRNHCLLEKIQSLATQKGANTPGRDYIRPPPSPISGQKAFSRGGG